MFAGALGIAEVKSLAVLREGNDWAVGPETLMMMFVPHVRTPDGSFEPAVVALGIAVALAIGWVVP